MELIKQGFLKARLDSETEFIKYTVAVEKCDFVVGQLSKAKTGRFAKTILFYLCRSNEISCKFEVTGNRLNLCNGEALQRPYNLHFTGDTKYTDKL